MRVSALVAVAARPVSVKFDTRPRLVVVDAVFRPTAVTRPVESAQVRPLWRLLWAVAAVVEIAL